MAERYTDSQMAAILKRAAEIQATGEEPIHELATIQEIAQQVGIDPKHVAEAAAALSFPNAAAGTRVLGASSAFRRSRQVSASLPVSGRAAVVAVIRDLMPQVGVVTEFADRLEWHAGPADNKTAISISAAAGGTLIRVEGRYFAPKFGLYAGAAALTLVASVLGAASSPLLGVGLGLVALVLSFGTARFLWNRVCGRSRHRLEQVLLALVEQLHR